MRIHRPSKSAAHPDAMSRRGFTLVELLVVIAIIALLAGMAAWAAVGMIANRQRSNTQATMRVVNKLLLTRWAAVVADSRKETPAPYLLATLAGGNPDVARVLWIKVRLAEAFPMKYTEMSATDTTTIVNTYIPANRRKPYFIKYQKAVAALKSGTPGESSACLLMALRELQGDGVSVDDQLKHAIAPNDGSLPPNGNLAPLPAYPTDPTSKQPIVNTINTLVDAYGCPFKFQRFYTNAPNPAPPNARNFRFGDTTDSDGRLITPKSLWYNAHSGDFEPLFHVISTDGFNSNYVIPMFYSMGPDRISIFDGVISPAPTLPAPFPLYQHVNDDNILSYTLGAE